ncbi:hypothetical protein [Candidatus Nitrosocosmicus sp. SS]|nr:hypothetical protein [Candidatus Nitrosocosmicus sp. SS]
MECRDTKKSFRKCSSIRRSNDPLGKRVQTINPPGSEVGPSIITTCGKQR